MALYVLFKLHPSFTNQKYERMLRQYKKWAYNEWFNSLTEEEQKAIMELKEQRRQKHDRELAECYSRLMAPFVALQRSIDRRMT